MLVPRELDMIAAGKHMPLPLPRPKFAEVEVKKHNGKSNADLAKVDARAAAAYAPGATGPRIAPSMPVSKQAKQGESTGIPVPSYGRNSSRPTVQLPTTSATLWAWPPRRYWVR